MRRQFKEGATMQVAMVVRDMEAAMKRHWDVFKIGPWDIYEFTPQKVQNYTYRGKPATHTCLIGVRLERRYPARADAAAHRLQHL